MSPALAACPTCSTGGNIPVQQKQTIPGVKLEQRKPLDSVGIVCLCGKALATMEGVARACECGRLWLVTVMLLGGDDA